MAVRNRVCGPTQCGITALTPRCTKGGCKLDDGQRMPGAGLSCRRSRKAPLGKPTFQPYWGKPAVRKCVQLKTGVFSRRQTCRGKSQEPRSSGGRVAGDQKPEAHRQGLPWGGYELPGRNNSERVVASKSVDPRAEPASVGRRQHGMPKSDRCGIVTSAG